MAKISDPNKLLIHLLCYLSVSLLLLQCKKETPTPPVDHQHEEQNTPPGEFKVTVGRITDSSAEISWEAASDIDHDSVYYSITVRGKQVARGLSQRTFTVNYLNQLATYKCSVNATDNKSLPVSVDFTFETPKYYLRFLKRYNYEYGGYGSASKVYNMVKANDDGYIIMGRSGRLTSWGSPQLFLLKVDNMGNEVWKKFYHSDTINDTQTRIAAISEGYIVTSCYHILKLDNQGNKVWDTRVDDFYTGDVSAALTSVKSDSRGNVYAVGFRSSDIPGVNAEAVIIKLDPEGHILFEKTIVNSHTSTQYYNVYDFEIDPADNLMVFGNLDYDFWVFHTTGDGRILWQKTYGAGLGPAFPKKIKCLSNGDYVFAGMRQEMNWLSRRILVRIKPNGDLVWQSKDESATGCIYGMDETGDGDIIATGQSSTGMGLFKYGKDGQLIWERSHGESGSVSGREVICANDRGYYIAGDVYLNPLEVSQALLFKTDPDGIFQ